MIGFRDTNSIDDQDSVKAIKNLNYQELEDKYDVLKYYPKFIHNGVSTPRIKDMLEGIPIYAEANKHVKKQKKKRQPSIQPPTNYNPYENGTSYTYSTRQARKGSIIDHQKAQKIVSNENSQEKPTDAYGDEFSFKDPFADTKKPTTRAQEALKEKVRPDNNDSKKEFYPLKKSQSYDQTRSTMTSERHTGGGGDGGGGGGIVFSLKSKLKNKIISTRKNSVSSSTY